jgi:hypothetical protein
MSLDTLLLVAEIAYNSYSYQSTRIFPYEADLGYILRMLLDKSASIQPCQLSRGYLVVNFVTSMANILKVLKIFLGYVQEQKIHNTQSKRQLHNSQESDRVFLSTKNLLLSYANNSTLTSRQANQKILQYKFMGSFILEKDMERMLLKFSYQIIGNLLVHLMFQV